MYSRISITSMYLVLVLPILSIIVAQGLKFFIKSNGQKVSLKNFVSYSGMPSGHSAMMISLVTIIGLEKGIFDPLFAISLILAIVVIRDALGIRRYLGEHGRTLNVLVNDLKDDDVLDNRYPHLLEHIGHTPDQALVGSIIGFVISLAGYFLLR